MSTLEAKLDRIPLPTAVADLSDLGSVETGWHTWDWGSQTALVRRVHTSMPDRRRPYGRNDGIDWEARFVAVIPFIYTHGVVWGYVCEAGLGYEDRWCYHRALDAVAAASVWNGYGDPPGDWHRHPKSGRRREGGREWVAE